jgi:methylated-DNA-[protein]-cysteine S-methyltransferase
MPLHDRPWVAQTTLDTPLGRLLIAATTRGLGGAWFAGQAHHPGPLDAPVCPGEPLLAEAAHALAAYWRQPICARFDLPLDPGGTEFQQSVWQALRGIEAGQLKSYGEIARETGRPQAARAVGAAIGRNPLSIIVPCHRVVGRQGALTGYAGGLDRKRALLSGEGHAAILRSEPNRPRGRGPIQP